MNWSFIFLVVISILSIFWIIFLGISIYGFWGPRYCKQCGNPATRFTETWSGGYTDGVGSQKRIKRHFCDTHLLEGYTHGPYPL
jgi:hypothetical protein